MLHSILHSRSTHSTTPNRLLDARYDLRKSPDQYGIFPYWSLVLDWIPTLCLRGIFMICGYIVPIHIRCVDMKYHSLVWSRICWLYSFHDTTFPAWSPPSVGNLPLMGYIFIYIYIGCVDLCPYDPHCTWVIFNLIRTYLYIYMWFVDTWSLLSVKTPRHGIYPDMSLVLDFYAYIAIHTFSFDENPPTNMGYTPILCRWSLTPMHISRYIHMRFDENPPTNMGFIPSNLPLVFDFHENPPTNMGHVPIWRGYLNIVTSIPSLSIWCWIPILHGKPPTSYIYIYLYIYWVGWYRKRYHS